MKSLKASIYVLMLLCIVSSTHAQDRSNRIVFEGLVVDGPFAQNKITGFCNLRINGDRFRQTSRCVVKLNNSYKIVDPKASVQIVGSSHALRIVLGANLNNADSKGNFKISAFQVTTYFDREISLFDIPDYFLAVDASIGGVSIAGGTSTTNPDCLIWDIAGDGVFN